MVNISPEQREAVKQAVRELKSNPFKTTAIKVEFEADLNRDNASNDQYYFEIEEDCQSFIDNLVNESVPVGKMVYSSFYNDGSVDSEYTFTLKLEEEDDIFYLIPIMEAWNTFCETVHEAGGSRCDVRGAGMHMALLNDPRGHYPGAMLEEDEPRFYNFRKSMTMLLPALYFLATHDDRSRGLEYRRPLVEIGGDAHGYSKFNAIVYKMGSIEFRVFDTCYEKPEAILDNVCVMANCMKFWSDKYRDPEVKIRKLQFGQDNSRSIERFYYTESHLDVLNYGLQLLKPSYHTITDLKKERNFKLTKNALKSAERKAKADAEKSYDEYKERLLWKAERSKSTRYADVLYGYDPRDEAGREVARQEAGKRAEEAYRLEMQRIPSPVQYIRDRLAEFQQAQAGRYTLEV